MEIEVLLVALIVLAALIIFITELFPVDLTALLIMVTLMLLRLVTPEEGLSGFSNHAVITILAMFILSAAVEKTGLIHQLSVKAFGLVGSREIPQLLVVMVLAAPFSAFLNNAAVVAILLPFVLNLSKMAKTSPSKLLIPLSYVSMAAGMLTIIGTSTNLIANSILDRYAGTSVGVSYGLKPFKMFDFWSIGAVVLGVTALYFVTVGYWILPKRSSENDVDISKTLRYTFELKVLKDSPLHGIKIKDSILRQKYRIKILGMQRGRKIWRKNFSQRVLEVGDILTLEATQDILANLESEPGVEIKIEELRRKESSVETIQMIIPQGSRFIGRRLEEISYFKRKKAAVLAVRKGLKTIKHPIEKVRLSVGDMLLIGAPKERIKELRQNKDLLFMEYLETNYRKNKRVPAILIMAIVVIIAALGIYPIVITALAGVVLMLLSKVITLDEAYQSIRWEVIFLLAGLIPLGIAFEKSGTATIIADMLGRLSTGLPLFTVLVGLYILTTLLTEVVSNNASVILLIPIGIDLSISMGLDPYPFILVIMFAASTSFLTPIGYKTNTMIYGTGVYKFTDFFKAGLFLNLALSVITPLAIMAFWR